MADHPKLFPLFESWADVHEYVPSDETIALQWAAYTEIHDIWHQLRVAVEDRAERISLMVAKVRGQRTGDERMTGLSFDPDESDDVQVHSVDSDGDTYSINFPVGLLTYSEEEMRDWELEQHRVVAEKKKQAEENEKRNAEAAKKHAEYDRETRERAELARLQAKYAPTTPVVRQRLLVPEHNDACSAKFNPLNRCTCWPEAIQK